MNLSDYEKLDTTSGTGKNGDFIGFEKTGDTKVLRFLYTSGGAKIGEDIELYKKYWNEETRKYEYGTERGTLTASLNCIEYDRDGKNPRRVRWERSAFFCKNTLLPLLKKYPRIIDGVWEVSATNPKTRDASYALFPIMDADTIKYPVDLPDAPEASKSAAVKPVSETKPAKTKPAKKYWE